MFESVTTKELRTQMEQHLLMVEEVLGGIDQFAQGLERRITRIEEGLGLEPGGIGPIRIFVGEAVEQPGSQFSPGRA